MDSYNVIRWGAKSFNLNVSSPQPTLPSSHVVMLYQVRPLSLPLVLFFSISSEISFKIFLQDPRQIPNFSSRILSTHFFPLVCVFILFFICSLPHSFTYLPTKNFWASLWEIVVLNYGPWLFFLKKKNYFLLEDNCFTMFCWFLLYNNGNRP